MSVDIKEYIRALSSEKFRAIIIHSESSLEKSKYALKLARQLKVKYFDILDYFNKNQSLSYNIDTFGISELTDLLIQESKGESIFIVDKIDFLLDKWRKQELESFFRLIREQWNSFFKGMEPTLIFFIETNIDLDSLIINDSSGKSRVHHLSEFKAI